MFYKRIRAWHKDKKRMYKVNTICFEHDKVSLDGFISWDCNYTDLDIEAYFSEVILMQESGMVDDRNFNVFEGDIIEFEKELFRVSYGTYGNSITGTNGFGWHLAGKEYTIIYVGGGEKVGNIFENPELITG